MLAQDPGYAFRLQQGQLALERAQAAGGGVGSGGALKAAAQYGQDYAPGEYGNAYQRFMQNRQANYSNLSQLAGLGSSATAQQGQQGQVAGSTLSSINTNAANTMGEDLMAGANATASGYVGAANAWNGALGQINNNSNQMLALAMLG